MNQKSGNMTLGRLKTSEDTNGGSHPESMWLFSCPDSESVHVPLWREGGEYNTREGNQPARKLTVGSSSGFQPPATSAVLKSLNGGAFNACRRGQFMTAKSLPTPENRLAVLDAAIASADRAVMGLQTAITIIDRNSDQDATLALVMLSTDIAHAVSAMRRCRDMLAASVINTGAEG
jgi:hypothetical protein